MRQFYGWPPLTTPTNRRRGREPTRRHRVRPVQRLYEGLIHERYDRMVLFDVSIAILNQIADSRPVLLNNCGHWSPFEKPAEWIAQVLAFPRVD